MRTNYALVGFDRVIRPMTLSLFVAAPSLRLLAPSLRIVPFEDASTLTYSRTVAVIQVTLLD